ncbi:hypothetical protein KKB99_05825 [bacterium]|nr:hypothetical protein [bacterium]MBU1025509.1 hypothetical protein [bacterium]
MKSIFIITALILLSFCIAGCGSQEKNKSTVLAEVNGEQILLEDIYKNPSFAGIIDQYINEIMIRQEFKARNLVLNEADIEEEWSNFVKMRGQGDEEKILNDLKSQGVTKSFIWDQIKTQVMLKDIIDNEFPSTMEDARKEFEGNLSANQKMYSGNVLEKAENPETITFEDVSEVVLQNMKRRVFSQEAQSFMDTLKEEYINQGWIINFVKPDEIDTLTKIVPEGTVEKTQMDPHNTAPIRRTGKGDKPDDGSESDDAPAPEEPEEPEGHSGDG